MTIQATAFPLRPQRKLLITMFITFLLNGFVNISTKRTTNVLHLTIPWFAMVLVIVNQEWLHNKNNVWGFTQQTHDMVMKHAVVKGAGYLDELGFFNVRLKLSIRAPTSSSLSKCDRRVRKKKKRHFKLFNKHSSWKRVATMFHHHNDINNHTKHRNVEAY